LNCPLCTGTFSRKFGIGADAKWATKIQTGVGKRRGGVYSFCRKRGKLWKWEGFGSEAAAI
jgi:hypothetical protein